MNNATEWIEMEGYKGLHDDLTGYNNFQYEMGKTYYKDDEIELCKNGFHFCSKLKQVFCYYSFLESNRFFKVKAIARKVERGIDKVFNAPLNDKRVAKQIVLLEEIDDKTIYEEAKNAGLIDSYLPILTLDNFIKFRKQVKTIDFRTFLITLCRDLLKDKYSDILINTMLDNAYSLNRIIYLTKIALILYEEGCSPDVRVPILIKEMEAAIKS